jgi:DNA-binding MarR family transcriptional regulator
MERSHALGPALRRAWVGYQRRLDDALAAAGFDDRAFPDGRVLRLCRNGTTTISDIGRELGITRQGAAKIVAGLRERGYVVLHPVPYDARGKLVSLTPRAHDYLEAQRAATRAIERDLRKEIGADAFDALDALLHALAGPDDDLRLWEYLRSRGRRDI